MKNVIIVGNISEDVKKSCLNIAKKLEYKFVDVEEKFDKILLNSEDNPLYLVDDILKEKERGLLKAVSNKNNILAVVPVDMFLSNGNYELFNSCFLVGIMNKNLNEIDKKIEKMLKNHVNLSINEENLSKNEIFEIISKEINNEIK